MESKQEMIKEAVDKMAEKFPDEDKNKHIEALTKVFEEGMLPQDALGFSQDFVEMLYAYAYKLFQSGKFDEAATAYKYLMVLCPFDVRQPMALAACYHKKRNYADAISNYIVATVLAPDSPMPYYHASDCFLKSDDKDGAIFMLTKAVEKAKENPEYAALLQRAELSLEQLQGQSETRIKP